MKSYPETHQRGSLSIEQSLASGLKDCDFGIQIAKDGRVWICVDGIAFIRFKPTEMLEIDVSELFKKEVK